MWEQAIDVNKVTELRLRTKVLFGAGAVNRIEEVLTCWRERGIGSILIVSGANAYKSTGAWSVIAAALQKNELTYAVCDKVTPNPTAEQVNAAVAVGRRIMAQAVIGIGGGSAIDAAKASAILLAEKDEVGADALFEYKFTPRRALPLTAVNLTHGTGTECNRFSVVTIGEKEYKPAIACDCIYPEFAIDDPALMTSLSPEQTRYVSVDVLNHAVEAATSLETNPLAVSMAKEAIALVAHYLPEALRDPGCVKARYFLLYASLLAGCAFDNGFLHLTHALEHPLSAVNPKLPHGLGLAMLLPAVVETVYPARGKVLAELLSPLVPDLSGESSESARAGKGLYEWLKGVGLAQKLGSCGFSEQDIGHLADLAFETPSLDLLLAASPVKADRVLVESIYRRSMI